MGVAVTLNVIGPTTINDRSEFAEALTALRETAGLTVREVAARTGMQPSTVGGYFSGRHLPPPRALVEILNACGVTDPEAASAWNTAWSRVRRAPGPRPATEPAPYKGLASFEPDEAEWFFGRTEIVHQLLRVVRQRHHDGGGIVFLIGASGSGKSSILRAGLMAGLQGILSTALFAPNTGSETQVGRSPRAQVLIVDQFEEALLWPEPERCEQLIASLQQAVDAGAVVIIGLRADCYGHAIRHAALHDGLRHACVPLTAMTQAEVREAIIGPARRANLTVEDGLVELLLKDLAPTAAQQPGGHDPGALPLLSHCLLTMWRLGRRSRLTVENYRVAGGLRGAVADTAEQAYQELSAAQQDVARKLFLRMVTIGEGGLHTRHPMRLEELPADDDQTDCAARDVREVLDVFVERRLITADSNGFQLSHEALIHAWPRLSAWIDTNTTSLRLRRELMQAVEVWQQSNHDPAALYRGGRLEALREWAHDNDDLSPAQHDFLDAALAHQDTERADAIRTARRLRRQVAGLMVLVLASAGSSAVAWRISRTAATDRDLALSRQLAAASQRERGNDTSRSAQLAVLAYRRAPTKEARSALLDSWAAPVATRLFAGDGVTQAITISRDGAVLAAAGEAGVVRLWSLTGSPGRAPQRLADLDTQAGALFGLAISPDRRTMVAAGISHTVYRWDLTNPSRPRQLPPLNGPTNTVYGLAFSPDGHTLAAASADTAVYRWDLSNISNPRRLDPPLTGATDYVQSLAFSPDGNWLAAGSKDHTVRLWNVRTPAHPVSTTLTGPTETVFAVTFSPDGTQLAAGSRDGHVYRWRTETHGAFTAQPTLAGPTSWVNSVVFSPDGTTLTAGSADNRVWRWDAQTGLQLPTLPTPAPVTAVTYQPNGRWLASASGDGAVRLWPTASGAVGGLDGGSYAVRFSADGRRLVTATNHDQAGLVDTSNPDRPRLLGHGFGAIPGPARLIGSATISPDGRLMAAGGNDGSVRLFSVPTDQRGNEASPTQIGPVLTGQPAVVEFLGFTPDGRTLAAAGDDGMIRLWDVKDPAKPRSLGSPIDLADNYVYAFAFNPDGTRLAAATANGHIWLVELADTAHPRVHGPLRGPASYLYAIAYSPDGTTIAAGGNDRDLWLWDIRDPEHPISRPPLVGPTNMINGVAFSPDGHTVAAGSADNDVYMWTVNPDSSTTALATLQQAGSKVLSLAYRPDGKAIAAGTDTGITLWPNDPQHVITEICRRAGDPMTTREWDLYLPAIPREPVC